MSGPTYPLHGTRGRLSIDEWNAAHPVGTPVRYYPVAGDRRWIETRTRTPAWALGSGHAVVSVEGQSGGVSLEHVEVCAADAARDALTQLLDAWQRSADLPDWDEVMEAAVERAERALGRKVGEAAAQ